MQDKYRWGLFSLALFFLLCSFFYRANAQEKISPEASIASAPSKIPFYLQETEKGTGSGTDKFVPPSNIDSASTFLRIIVSLGIVIALAFSASWFLQKKSGISGNSLGKVIGILPIGNRKFIYIVDIVGKVLILGVTDSNINSLGEVTDKHMLDSLRLESNSPSIPGIEKIFSFLNGTKSDSTISSLEENKNIVQGSSTEAELKINNINKELEKRND